MNVYSALCQSQLLRPLDIALAKSLRRLDPATPDAVLAAAALASCALQAGHAGLDVDDIAALVPDPALVRALQTRWAQDLPDSRWVECPPHPAQPSAPDKPLVLEHGLLYLRRYREYERQLACDLHRLRACQQAPARTAAVDELRADERQLREQLFPDPDDPQARAALGAMQSPLLLITGGPGTGKTTTVARILLLLIARAHASAHDTPGIHLAAPTGQAAARMAASVRRAAQDWQAQGVDPALCAALPTKGQTLHRLLGSTPDHTRPRHHAGNPLRSDILVVDEVSMIDLPLMSKLVAAVADGTGLIMLGDPDQLPAVGVGDVLGQLVRAHSRLIPEVHLQRGYRQSEQLELAPLASAVRNGEAAQALRLLRSGELSQVYFYENMHDPLDIDRAAILAPWRRLMEARTPAQALAQLHQLRILTAVRDGPQGAGPLNARIHALLAGPAARAQRHFHGQPILITHNSHRQGLFNGDLGVCHRGEDGTLLAFFAGDSEDAPRAFHLPALPAHEPAFATTVHKAQGAEFDRIWLVLPEHDSQVLSRALIYTAITRARQQLHVVGSAERLNTALSRPSLRHSRLALR